jgi:cytochrome c oxidase assembly factor CtaG
MSIQELLGSWPLTPPVLVGIGVCALLYWRGLRYSVARGLARHVRVWHPLAFAAGLLVVLLALDSPLEVVAGQLLWAHMVQHELLTIVAAPLLVLSRPAWPLWRGVPLPLRRAGLGWMIRQPWPRRTLAALSNVVLSPGVAWALFTGGFTLWHIPALYDAALEQQPLHALEHLTFLVAGLLFWTQVMPSRHARHPLSFARRAVYVAAAGVASSVLGAVFVFSTGPIYAYYAALPRADGALSVLADQHLAGAAMDVPATIVFFVAIIALLGYWLQEDERAPDPAAAPAIARH